jgi:hypothetical protein
VTVQVKLHCRVMVSSESGESMDVQTCVSNYESRLMLGHCSGDYPHCALRHGVALLSRFPPEQV